MLDEHLEPDSTSPWVHEDSLPDIEAAKEYLKEVLYQLYVEGDTDKLENSLEELCGCFDISLPSEELILKKKDPIMTCLKSIN